MNLEQYLKSRYTPRIVKNYGAVIQNYLSERGKARAQRASYAEVVAYIGALRSRYTNAATIRKTLSAVKAYYAWLCYSGQRVDNPAKSISLKDKQRKDIQLQDLFTEAELEALLVRADTRGLLSCRNKVLISFLIYQALQPKEIEKLRTEDIDLSRGLVTIRPDLMSSGRTLQLKPQQVMLLHEYLTGTRPQLLINSAEHPTPPTPEGDGAELLVLTERGRRFVAGDLSKHILQRYGKMHGKRVVQCKTIRQSVIANLLKKGADLRVVQVFAGHKSPGTTERYRQTDVDALKAAVVKHHPFA